MATLRTHPLVRRCIRKVGTQRALFVLRTLQLPLRGLLRPLVRSLPRDPAVIAFGASLDRFAENSAYLYLHMSPVRPLTCVWLSGSRRVVKQLRGEGLVAYHRRSLAGIRAALTAGWYVYSSYPSDINGWLYDGAVLMNLWHGAGLKKIERDMEDPFAAWVRESSPCSLVSRALADQRKRPDWMLSTGPFMSAHFSSAFDVPLHRCLELGYPRNDHFASAQGPPRAVLDDQAAYERLGNADLVLGYFPTWRHDGWSPQAADDLLLCRLASIIAAKGGLLLYKPHSNDNATSVESPNVVSLRPRADLNAYLPLCDVLVTDYSAVGYDFLLLDRPIIYYCPDFETYRRTHGLHGDPLPAMPGPLCRTRRELEDVVSHVETLTPAPNAGRVTQQFWAQPAGGAAARIGDFIASAPDPRLRARPD
jgi:CDP-glycerol glycerophosphotransferase (TagB/SpsB family)